ncbi:MAG: helix-hairpin-helix domain-containing protein [Bacteroidota bacterium]
MNLFLQFLPTWEGCSNWWLWSALMFLLGALIPWLLGLFRGKKVDVSGIEAERDSWHAKATKWEKDYQSVKYQLEESQKSEADLRAALQSCEADRQTLRYNLEQAGGDDTGLGIVSGGGDGGSAFAGLFANDNLQIIEGVGPKIEGVLQDAGYKTWDDVAAADASALKAALEAAGSRYKLADPTSWPHQAKLAAAGDWDELIRYQKFTDAGRETVGDFETDSKFEKLAAKKLGFSSTNPNDLKVVEGIGPKIEGLLKDAGINTWSELAEATVDRIQGILDAAGDRYKLAKPGTWPEQAGLAASGNWDALKTLQDNLKGGV